ncbi:hypothetical protein EYC84_001839 [Monilinia fructicola]|uniref:Uncharacterized protein n=1 Tax=Monilinia fructicola TaxID=38448 RepID=A0A5M9JT72_MONFR|nr:hypothetical protein EYC84_001839 [Monilinia fructicola]
MVKEPELDFGSINVLEKLAKLRIWRQRMVSKGKHHLLDDCIPKRQSCDGAQTLDGETVGFVVLLMKIVRIFSTEL